MYDLLIASVDSGLPWLERLAFPFIYNQVPLVVSTLIGATLGLVGCFVVLRRMALLGDALSHAVLPGVALAFLLISGLASTRAGHALTTGSMEVWGLFLGALIAGLFTSFGISVVARHSRVKEDTAIGIVFTAMFAIGVVLVSSFPQGTHFDLKCFLFGEPLAIRQEDLYTTLVVSPVVLGLILLFYRPLKLVSFDAQMAAASGMPVRFIHYLLMGLLSATVVTALQSVGVIMSVAMLITPAAIAYQLTNRLSVMLALSALAGAISALAGFLLAFMSNWPLGPAMVIVATMLFGGTMLLAPEYGALAKALRRRRVRRHILEEDVLKSLTHLASGPTEAAVWDKVGRVTSRSDRDAALEQLSADGMIRREADNVHLTEAGRERADALVRSHRLWETYLAEHNVPPDMLHDIADRLEHAHDVAEEIADELGHPEVDPHGEPIPQPKRGQEA